MEATKFVSVIPNENTYFGSFLKPQKIFNIFG